MTTTYKSAGVDIEAGEETVRRIAASVKSTFSPAVLTELGSFGAMYDARFTDYDEPVLVSSVDGVGTKLKVASMHGVHHTIGQDLVNHCVNDILTTGAKPIFFLDYFATGKLNPEVAAKVVEGLVIACKENSCALIGGETAEMPGMYAPNEYDIAGTIVGIVEKAKILRKENVAAGNVLIGLPSTGLHTNGFSLARAVLLKHFSLDAYFDELGGKLGDVLLAVHRSYFKLIYPLLSKYPIHVLSHITGGGIVSNTVRVIPDKLKLKINWNAWNIPPIFSMIQKLGDVPLDDMRRTFNLGVGMIIIVSKDSVDEIVLTLKSHGEHAFVMGEVTT